MTVPTNLLLTTADFAGTAVFAATGVLASSRRRMDWIGALVLAVVVCNPSNPTGKVFTRAELLEVLALAEKHDAFVITDEPCEHIVYEPHMHVSFHALPVAFFRTITCNSLSKTYSITGWRLGYVLAAPEVVAQARKAYDFLTVGAASPLQEAAVTGLDLPDSYYSSLRASYTEKRDLFLGALQKTGLDFSEPQGAYYVLVDISPLGFATDTEAPSDSSAKSAWQGFRDRAFSASARTGICASTLPSARRHCLRSESGCCASRPADDAPETQSARGSAAGRRAEPIKSAMAVQIRTKAASLWKGNGS